MSVSNDVLISWLICLAVCVVTLEKVLGALVHYRVLYGPKDTENRERMHRFADRLQALETGVTVINQSLSNGLKQSVRDLLDHANRLANRLERIEATLEEMRRNH